MTASLARVRVAAADLTRVVLGLPGAQAGLGRSPTPRGDTLGGAAPVAGLDVDVKYAPQALRTGRDSPAFGGLGVYRHTRRAGFIALAALG